MKKSNLEKGFSLVEVMIVVGIMGAVALGITHLMKNMQQGTATAESSFDILQISNTVSIFLSSEQGCFNNLKQAGALTTTKPIFEIKNQSDNTVYKGDGDTRYGKVVIKAIEVTGTSSLVASGANQLVNLEISFEKKGGAVGAGIIKKSFPVNVSLNASKEVTACYSIDNALIDKAHELACKDLNGSWTAGGGCSLSVSPTPANWNSAGDGDGYGRNVRKAMCEAISGAATQCVGLNIAGNAVIGGSATVSGNLAANQITGTQITGTVFSYSDRRLKKNIHSIENPDELLAQIRGKEFDWKKDGRRSFGVIAQELEEVYPDLVVTNGDGKKAVDYNSLLTISLESQKLMQQKILFLEKEIEALKEAQKKK